MTTQLFNFSLFVLRGWMKRIRGGRRRRVEALLSSSTLCCQSRRPHWNPLPISSQLSYLQLYKELRKAAFNFRKACTKYLLILSFFLDGRVDWKVLLVHPSFGIEWRRIHAVSRYHATLPLMLMPKGEWIPGQSTARNCLSDLGPPPPWTFVSWWQSQRDDDPVSVVQWCLSSCQQLRLDLFVLTRQTDMQGAKVSGWAAVCWLHSSISSWN